MIWPCGKKRGGNALKFLRFDFFSHWCESDRLGIILEADGPWAMYIYIYILSISIYIYIHIYNIIFFDCYPTVVSLWLYTGLICWSTCFQKSFQKSVQFVPSLPLVASLIQWVHRAAADPKSFGAVKQPDTVDGSEILHQLRLVVYPIIYRLLYIPGGCLGFRGVPQLLL